MTTIERIGFEASVSLEKDNAFLRGWRVGNDEVVVAKVAAYNAREFARCKAAALELLDL
jgi:hypothetical protein